MSIRHVSLAFIVAGVFFAMANAAEPGPGKANYERPFEPPTRSALIPLPPGAVEPAGWLRDWCLAAKDGYTGHMDDVDVAFRQAWAADYKVTGDRISLWELGGWPYEGGGYWFDGLAKLGFVLHDDALIQQAKKRLNAVVDNMTPNSIEFMWWLDRNKPEDLKAVEGRGLREPEWPMWVNGLLGRAMVGYYAGSGEPRILKTLETAYSGSPDWLRLGWAMSNPWPAFETYTWTGNKVIKQGLDTLFAKGGSNEKDWSWNRYRKSPSDKPGSEATTHGVHFCESTAPWALGYLWTGRREFLDTVLRWHEMLERDCMQPHGVPVFDEYFGPSGAFRGTETCDVAGYMWSQMLLLSVSGQGRLADRIERAFFNAGPGCVARDFKSHAYFQSPNRMADKSLPVAGQFSFQPKHIPLCCSAALNRILPNYVANMWMATHDNGLAAVCYGPCKVSGLVADRVPVVITCRTDYPFNETIEITVTPEREAKFPLAFRIPGWCQHPRLKVNGAEIVASPDGNGFVRIERRWKPNDKISLLFPMSPSIATGRDANAGNSPYASVSLGPLLFALPIADTKDANTPDPAAKWQFAIDAQSGIVQADLIVVSPDITVERGPMPGKWDWPLASPLKLRARALGIDWKPTLEKPLPPKPFDGGKPAEWITLVPYGCTKFRVSMLPVTKWTFEKPEPVKESDGWGPERDGLRTRLLPAQKEFFVGRPVRFRLEMKNFGKQARRYDPQDVRVDGSVHVTGPDGKPVPYLGRGYQTMGTNASIASGENVELFDRCCRSDSLDLANWCLFVKPGSYTLRFPGAPGGSGFEGSESTSEIPPSNAITIEMRPGTPSVSVQVSARLIEILPKGWGMSFGGGVHEDGVYEVEDGKIAPPGWELGPGTYLPLDLCPESGLISDVMHVDIWVAEKKLAWTGTREFDHGKGRTTIKISPDEGAGYLGKGADGHIYWIVPKEAEKQWPDIRKKVTAALQITPAEAGARAPK